LFLRYKQQCTVFADEFVDIDKSINDSINDDFDSKFSLKIKSSAPFGVTLTSTHQFEPCKESKINTKVAIKYPQSSDFVLDKFEVANNGSVAVETSLTGVSDGLKIKFKGNDSDKGDLSYTYTVPEATVTGDLDILNFSKTSASVTTGTGPFTVGLFGLFNLTKSNLETVDVAVAYAPCSNFYGVLRANKTFSAYSALLSYVVNKNVSVAAKANHCSKQTGGFISALYSCNADTKMKFKVHSSGTLYASLKQNFDKKFSVVGSAEVPAGFTGIKFGVNATLG